MTASAANGAGAGFRSYLRFTRKWVANGGYSPRRVVILVAYIVFVPLIELTVWTGFLLDRLIFYRFRKVSVRAPVFVIGNFRSGTTKLHRLLANDTANFTTMSMWEVLFAPSIIQRRLTMMLVRFDQAIGRPAYRLNRWLEKRWRKANVMHDVSFAKPEEDEYLCLHIWSALTIGLSSGVLDEARRYGWFDEAVAESDRRRIMSFYHRCIQRHLYAAAAARKSTDEAQPGTPLTYLAKNPAMSAKVGSLLELYPDCRIVYVIRNPLEAVPSFISMMAFSWQALGVRQELSELVDLIVDMAAFWYRNTLDCLDAIPGEQYRIVRYEDLVDEPESTVRGIYEHFGLPIDRRFAARLARERTRATGYRSRHIYDLAEYGLTRDDIVNACPDVFERFGFATD